MHLDKRPISKSMKLQNRRRALFITAVALVLVLMFQNMSFVEFVGLNISPINEQARQQQAQELLGHYYPFSQARKTEYHPYLNYFLLKEVEKEIAPEFKSYVPALTDAIIRESSEFGFDPIFIFSIIKTESMFNPNARGTSGEIGLMQVKPDTAKWIADKFDVDWRGDGALYDPVYNVKIGVRYFSLLRSKFAKTAYYYIPAYNMGPTNVRNIKRDLASDTELKDLEFAYSKKVMANYKSTYRQLLRQQLDFEKRYVRN